MSNWPVQDSTNIFHSPVIIGRFLCSRSLDVIYILPTNTSGESVTFSGHPRWVGTDYGEFPWVPGNVDEIAMGFFVGTISVELM